MRERRKGELKMRESINEIKERKKQEEKIKKKSRKKKGRGSSREK